MATTCRRSPAGGGAARSRPLPGALRRRVTMSSKSGAGHLWAVGYADMERAKQVKDEVTRLGWDEHYLNLSDIAVVVRHPDGSFTLNREPFSAVANVLGTTV